MAEKRCLKIGIKSKKRRKIKKQEKGLDKRLSFVYI